MQARIRAAVNPGLADGRRHLARAGTPGYRHVRRDVRKLASEIG